MWPPMSYWEMLPVAPYERQIEKDRYEENVLVTRLVQDKHTKSPVGTIAHVQPGGFANDGKIQGPALIARELGANKVLTTATKWDAACYNRFGSLLYKEYWKALPFKQRLDIVLGHITIPVAVSLIVSIVISFGVSLLSFWLHASSLASNISN